MNGYLDMELLRFTTAGSVDDGKSTLIGRLLYDSKSIFEDQLEAVKLASKHLGGDEVNLALLTDGLRAEREQGITIDVAYRYFATPRRKFIIADTPGHIEYTRNMVTGASTADSAIILVDARHGILEQTKRHSYIASLLRLDYVVVAINKMDLVDFSEEVYRKIQKEYASVAEKLDLKQVYYIPISARDGDNVVNPSVYMPWYTGGTLLHLLETLPLKNGLEQLPMRLPVQYVIRPQNVTFPDYRAYAGRLASGKLKVGDKVTILPSLTHSTVTAIDEADKTLQEAAAPQSVAVSLADDVDVSRGCILVKQGEEPCHGSDIPLLICWLNHCPLSLNHKYIIRHATGEMMGMVKEIDYKVNINTLEQDGVDKRVDMNDIVYARLKTSKPLHYDYYAENRLTGSLVFIDASTFETVGAGMITDPTKQKK
ncbi:GTP-binding protein [Bacteroides sp.]|uniref:sulfate adenylyltransferase subunit 1 n=1 Tax=Bacteroides sp. TaxID=29523 RepID=UPI002FCB0B59